MSEFESSKAMLNWASDNVEHLRRIANDVSASMSDFKVTATWCDQENALLHKMIFPVVTDQILVSRLIHEAFVHCRHSLDMATAAVWERAGIGPVSRKLYFPISSSEQQLEKRLSKSPLLELPEQAKAVIRRWAPFPPDGTAGNQFLCILNETANTKHRLLPTCLARPNNITFDRGASINVTLIIPPRIDIFRGEMVIARSGPSGIFTLEQAKFDIDFAIRGAGEIDEIALLPNLTFMIGMISSIIRELEYPKS